MPLLERDEIIKRLDYANKKYNTNYIFMIPDVYTGVHQKITAKCPSGHQFQISIDNEYHGKGCPTCANQKTAERCRLSPHDALSKLQLVWGNTYDFIDIDNYNSAHEKLSVLCKVANHGIFHASYANLYSGKGCPKCGNERVGDLKRFSPQQALSNIQRVHGMRYGFPYIDTEYTGAYADLTVDCQIHGKFKLDYDHLMMGGGCPKCGLLRGYIKRRNVPHQAGLCDYDNFYHRLTVDDHPSEGARGELQVQCKYCHRVIVPTAVQVRSRIGSLNGTNSGECNFYCSEECKQKCDVYGTRSDTHILAQRINDYEAKVKLARNCQLETKTILRKQQIDQYGYHFCEKCGTPVENPELHHTIKVAKDPSGSITIAGQMLVCCICHKQFTAMCR